MAYYYWAENKQGTDYTTITLDDGSSVGMHTDFELTDAQYDQFKDKIVLEKSSKTAASKKDAAAPVTTKGDDVPSGPSPPVGPTG